MNLTQDQINPELYTFEMIKPFDKNYGDKYAKMAVIFFAAITTLTTYKLKQALKTTKQELSETEPDDQWRLLYHPLYKPRVLHPSGFDWFVNKDPTKFQWTFMFDDNQFWFE